MISEELRSALAHNRSSHWEEYFTRWNNTEPQEDNSSIADGFVLQKDLDLAICSKCGTSTGVPSVFEWKEFLCDGCLVSSSGHQTCSIQNCQRCIKLGDVLSKRKALIQAFDEGILSKNVKQGYFVARRMS